MSSKSAAAIEPGSLADRVCRWFGMSSNRGEERTPDELAKQFDAPKRIVVAELGPAVQAHLLVFTQGDSAMVYQRGTRLLAWLGEHAMPAIAPAPKRRRGPLLPDLDLNQVKVRLKVPVPPRLNRRQKGHTRWDELFDKLEAPGSSVLLDRPYYAPIAKAAQAYTKRTGRKFVVRHVDAAQFGVWHVVDDQPSKKAS